MSDDFIGGIVMDLPVPPSVNRIWRVGSRGRVCISSEYAMWKKEADEVTLLNGQFRGMKTIQGKFEVRIVVKRIRGDLDNRGKPILDWLQSRAVVTDDKNCERLVIEWGDVRGCRVTVIPRSPRSVGDVLRNLEAV